MAPCGHRCENIPVLIPSLYSKSTLARLLNLDSRTATNRLKKLSIKPAAVLGNGRELFDDAALSLLRQEVR